MKSKKHVTYVKKICCLDETDENDKNDKIDENDENDENKNDENDEKFKKYRKVKDHYHYTRKFRGAPHSNTQSISRRI